MNSVQIPFTFSIRLGSMLRAAVNYSVRSYCRIASMSISNNIRKVIENCDVFLFDCDGVIWKGGSAVEGAAAAIAKLRSLGKTVKFVTNNSMKSRAGFLDKFKSMGIPVTIEDIYCSSFAAAAYLTKNPMKPHQKVFVIGHSGIDEELAEHNIPCISGREFNDKKVSFGPGAKMDFDPDVGAVVVGIDLDINYYKIQYAQLCLNNNEGCRFIATNMDRVAHITDAQEWAAGGAAVGAIRGCTGKEPVLVGKPSSFLVDHILGLSSDQNRDNTSDSTSKSGNSSSDSNSGRGSVCGRERVCMVGDNLQTDILFGLSSGLQTVLVLSGVTSQQQLLSEQNQIRPHYYCNSIADLIV